MIKKKSQLVSMLLYSRPILTMSLIAVSIASVVAESVGFGLLIPLFEILTSTNSDSVLSGVLTALLKDVGIRVDAASLLILFLALIFVKSFLLLIREYMRSYYVYSYKLDISLKIHEYFFKIPFTTFESKPRGDLINDSTIEIQKVCLLLLKSVDFITATISVFVFALVILMTDLMVGLVTLAGGLSIFVFSRFVLGSYSNRVGSKEVSLSQVLTGYLTEAIVMQRDYRINNLYHYSRNRISIALLKMRKLLVNWDVMSAGMPLLIELGLAALVVGYFGYRFYYDERGFLSALPSMIVIVLASYRILQQTSKLSSSLLSITKYKNSLDQLESYRHNIDRVAINNLTDCSQNDDQVSPIFELRNVFYSRGVRPVLRDLSLSIHSGSVNLVVGSSGVGKSTLMDIITGFIRPDAGEVLFRGISVNQIDPVTYFTEVAFVSQNSTLRSDTVINNLIDGATGVTFDDIRTVCEELGVHEMILSLKDGYSFFVGDAGMYLSGGQRQRLMLCKALLRNPSVLIMDEATSALDERTERDLTERLCAWAKRQHATLIVVTHNTSAYSCEAEKIVLSDTYAS